MDYKKIYEELCYSRKVRKVTPEKSYEVHHIIPKSMGGSDEIGNLVKLTWREHFIAHRLLTKYLKGEDYVKMEYALFRLSDSHKHKYGKDYDKSKTLKCKLSCNVSYLLPTDELFLPYSRTETPKSADRNSLRFILKSLGSRIDDRQIPVLRDILSYLSFSYVNGYNGVTGLRRSKVSTERMITGKLYDKGFIEMHKPEGKNFTVVSLTEYGGKMLPHQSQQLKHPSIIKGLSNSIGVVGKWNKDNPTRLVRLVRNGRDNYNIEPYNRWGEGFVNYFEKFANLSRNDVIDIFSKLNN